MYLSIYSCIYLISIYPCICLSYIYLCICLFYIYLFMYLSILYLSMYLSILYLSIHVSICLSIHVSILYLSINVSVYFISIYSCICLFYIYLSICPNFRGPRGDYWYMGAKCDQMWNTLDLILVTVLPAVALAVAVVVTAQLIHFCNATKKENAPKSKPQAERLTVHSHQNHGYEPYMINNQRYTEISQVNQGLIGLENGN
uniref:Uncharacterized protein n=1 Tax=Leptobrachium leishanense TaxID=445787 RepID=A0A8C5PGV5_9ANUR